jgi:HD-GYP domain-containing protein (c-di-GMP phosphodiesterase class II)
MLLPPATQSLVADALSRIPSAHFRDMIWVTDSIAACTAMVVEAVNGDATTVRRWVKSARGDADVAPLISILSAVCDSIVADAYRMRGDVSAITTFVISLEREVLGRLTIERRDAVNAPVNDAETAELADALVRIVAAYDRQTATHLDATAVLARRIAVAMQLTPDRIGTVELAARLHDIGNISVRTELLRKPGPLTAEEWNEMSLHPIRGAAALLDTPKLAHLAPIVRAHHERIDGEGYPDKVAGDAIPIEARIIAVADAFHAMTTVRPYRQAMMPNAALRVLARNAGSQFDVDVVDATFELFEYSRRGREANNAIA